MVTGDADRPRRRADRPAEQRPALELLLARPPRADGPGARRAVRRRDARRRAARADRDLRARRARAAALRHPRPRPRPHHRRRAAEPAAAQRGRGLRDRGPAARAADHRARDRARRRVRRRGVGGLQHGLRLRRRRPGGRARDAAAALLAAHHPGTRRIGTVTDRAGALSAPGGRQPRRPTSVSFVFRRLLGLRVARLAGRARHAVVALLGRPVVLRVGDVVADACRIAPACPPPRARARSASSSWSSLIVERCYPSSSDFSRSASFSRR